MVRNIAVIGGSGAIGSAMVRLLASRYDAARITAFSRSAMKPALSNVTCHRLDYQDEDALAESAAIAANGTSLDLVFVATGILHEGQMMPEKAMKEVSAASLHRLFEVNTILPALFLKHFSPLLNRDQQSVFACLSARVGSISDNRLGGWHAYRASKAALNMIIKNAAIETARRNKQAVIVGMHPGTVDSGLSAPFQRSVPEGQLFSPEKSAAHMLSVLETLSPEQSGGCFAWDRQEIAP